MNIFDEDYWAPPICIYPDGDGLSGDEWGNAICLKEIRIKELEKALEPFAKEAEFWAQYPQHQKGDALVKMEHLKNALQILKKNEG